MRRLRRRRGEENCKKENWYKKDVDETTLPGGCLREGVRLLVAGSKTRWL